MEGLPEDASRRDGLCGFCGGLGAGRGRRREEGVEHDGEDGADRRHAGEAETAFAVGPDGGDAEAEGHDEGDRHRAGCRAARVEGDGHEGGGQEKGGNEEERVGNEERSLDREAEDCARDADHHEEADASGNGEDESLLAHGREDIRHLVPEDLDVREDPWQDA